MTPLDSKEDAAGGLGGAHTRRSFLKGLGLMTGAVAVMPEVLAAADGKDSPAEKGFEEFGREPRKISLQVNGKPQNVEVEPRTTLLETLRDRLGLTGSKEVCDRGSCGACTVLLDGKAVNACMILAMDAVGASVVTIEGIAADPKYAKLIDSFCEHDAAQCGFCIPGFVVRTAEVLDSGALPTDPGAVRACVSGNLCRCGTYSKIFEAVAAMGGAK